MLAEGVGPGAAAAAPSAESWNAEALLADFQLRLEVFEGPLHLLLTLIRRERLEIGRVALVEVTGQYLAYIERLATVDPHALAAFCEVAATLMLLKSRSLLPRAPEEDEGDEAAHDLVERLRAYSRFRAAADRLGHRERGGLRAYVRPPVPPSLPPAQRAAEIGVADLAKAFQEALAEMLQAAPAEPAVEALSLPKPRVRLSLRYQEIRDLLRHRGRIAFREALLGQRLDREYVLVSFLAVLELLRRRLARAVQEEVFAEIYLQARETEEGWTAEVADLEGDDGLA